MYFRYDDNRMYKEYSSAALEHVCDTGSEVSEVGSIKYGPFNSLSILKLSEQKP